MTKLEIVRKVDSIISSAAKSVVRKGGSYDQTVNEVVSKVTRRFPGLDTAVLVGGFAHRYTEQLRKAA
jgi:hypothetical protein